MASSTQNHFETTRASTPLPTRQIDRNQNGQWKQKCYCKKCMEFFVNYRAFWHDFHRETATKIWQKGFESMYNVSVPPGFGHANLYNGANLNYYPCTANRN